MPLFFVMMSRINYDENFTPSISKLNIYFNKEKTLCSCNNEVQRKQFAN